MLFVAIHAQYTIPVLFAIFIDYVQCDAFQVKSCFVTHEKCMQESNELGKAATNTLLHLDFFGITIGDEDYLLKSTVDQLDLAAKRLDHARSM